VKPVSGHLEITDRGFGFLRDVENNFRPDPADPFVPARLIRNLRLPEGVLIEGDGQKGTGKNRNRKLALVKTVNGLPPESFGDVGALQDQVSVHPSERITLAQGPEDLLGRSLDMIVPIGKGQRGLIVSPPKAGKTTILKHMAESLAKNHPETKVFVLLVDERPEEVTDFKRGLENACVLYSSSDQSLSQHMRMTRLAINTAMRAAETGGEAVVFIDSLTRMARAFNAETRSHGRTLSGGLAATAMEIPRKIFGAARNVENGGSLTIIASILVDTGSRMDDIIFQEFKGTGNMELVLSRACAEQRIWPAVHIQQSGTRNERLLLEEAEYTEAVQIRRALSRLDETNAMSALLEHLDRDG
jgi:transcription termination factor Rho